MSERRSYNKVRRAAAEDKTRTRIVDALLELHEEVGPARTTVSAIAARAGVQRLTVYRHFPDETSMLRACSGRWGELNPLPEIVPFETGNPLRWFRRVLLSVYQWYGRNERMLTQIATDAERMPALRAMYSELERELEALAGTLDRAWPRRNSRRLATIRHALDFTTWRSLSRVTGSNTKAAAIVVSWLK